MSRTVQLASNAAATTWDSLHPYIAWPGMQLGGVANNCEIGTGSGFDLDDDAGTRVMPVKRVVRSIEDATVSPTTLFRGRVSDKGTARGKMPMADAKQFDVSLDDIQADFRGIVVDGWSRPAETDVARVHAVVAAFLSGDPRPSTVIDDTTYVPNTNLVFLPAKKYDETDPAGVLQDCATSAGKQVFATVDQELFYDLDTSVAYAALLSITDDGPDLADSFPPIEPHAREEGNEFFTGAIMKYGTSGRAEAVRSAAEVAHDYWRTIYNDPGAFSSTAATRLGTFLDNRSIEEYTATCSIALRADQVDKIKFGQTVSFRSAAADQYDPIILRVASLYWEPVGQDMYIAHLELGIPQKMRPRVPRPTAPPDDGPDSDDNRQITDDDLEAGDALTMSWYSYDDGVVPAAWNVELNPGVGTWLGTNDGWPSTPCGVGSGAWRDPVRFYSALVGTAPIDDGYLFARLSITVTPGDHGTEGFLVGAVPATHGPVIVGAGMAGSTPSVDDIDASGSIAGGIAVGAIGQADVIEDTDLDISRNAIPWGDDFRILFAPGWHLTTDYMCVQEAIDTGALNDGWVGLTAVLTPYKLKESARGWVTAAPKGTQDGSNTTFTLLGGYSQVSDLFRNGLSVPADAWRATGGNALETVGWAPLATDDIQVRYLTTGLAEPPIFVGGSGVVLTLTAANSEADMEAATRNMDIDIIEFSNVDGPFPWEHVRIDVDRTARPLEIRTDGSVCTFNGDLTTSGILFMFGDNLETKHIFINDPHGNIVFDGLVLAQSGVIELRDCDYIEIYGTRPTGLVMDPTVSGAGPHKSWFIYGSGAGKHGGSTPNSGSLDHIHIHGVIPGPPAANRGVSFIQVGSSGSHGEIILEDIHGIDEYHYVFSADADIANLILDDLTFDDSGRTANNSSIRILSGTHVDGTYSNIVATDSEPFVNAGTGTMVDGGGNSGI